MLKKHNATVAVKGISVYLDAGEYYAMDKKNKAQRMREASFGFLIQSLARRIDATMKQELEKQGVDLKIFANLMMLAEEDGMNQRQLGKKLNYPEYYTSRNIDAMVEAGFAERRPDPNSRRSFLVFLTQAGKDKAAALPSAVRDTNETHLVNLTKDEQQMLVKLLQKAAGISG